MYIYPICSFSTGGNPIEDGTLFHEIQAEREASEGQVHTVDDTQGTPQQDVKNPPSAGDGLNSEEPRPDAVSDLVDIPVLPPVNDVMNGFMDAGLTDYEFEEEGIVESVDYTANEVRTKRYGIPL